MADERKECPACARLVPMLGYRKGVGYVCSRCMIADVVPTPTPVKAS